MNRSFAVVLALTVAVVGCAKEKNQPVATTPAGALSSNDQCAAIACQTPPKKPGSKPAPVASSTSTNTATDTQTRTDPAPAPAPAPQPTPDPGQDKEALNDTQKMAKNVTVTCKGNDCDPSVGLLSIVLKNGAVWNAGQCTASLIGPDLIVTNAHCIPNDLVASGSNCQNRFWITFGATPGHPEYDKQIGCSQVLYRHKDGGMDGADYAYIKLARATNRPVYRQSQAGFADNQLYHLHKINPGRIPGGIAGMMEKVDCRSRYNSAIFSAPLDTLSQTSLFVDCRVIPGNSGAPIIADDGAVHGVMYAFVKKADIHKILDKNGASVPTEADIADLNTGSNFACLNMPDDIDGHNLPKVCANQLERLAQKRAQAEAARVKVLRPAAQKMIQDKAEGRSDILAFGWTLSTSTSEALGPIGLGVPECVNQNNAKALLAQDTPIHRPFFYIKATYDKYLAASDFAPVWGGFSTSPESMNLKLGADSSYQLDISDPDSGQAEFNAGLEACKMTGK